MLKQCIDVLNSCVRPVLALAFGGGVIALTYMGTLNIEAFIGFATMVLTWYFKNRDEKHEADKPPAATQ